jgi:hypothetical protein
VESLKWWKSASVAALLQSHSEFAARPIFQSCEELDLQLVVALEMMRLSVARGQSS